MAERIELAPLVVDASTDMGTRSHLDAAGEPRIIVRRFVVDEDSAGFRLDHYLKRQIPRLSRTKLQDVIRHQLEPVRGRQLKPSASVHSGDVIVMSRRARPEPPCPRTIGVLYSDPHMLVIDKPAGLPVHASARFYFNTLTRVLGERFPGQPMQICHRLDRETSGALVVARGKPEAARLKGAFADKRAHKTYLALVWGDPPWPDGAWDSAPEDDAIIDLPLGLVADESARIKIRMEVRAGALPSLTRVRVLERRGRAALVRCLPLTGRQHQIRAHLAACGHPIVGDKLYAHGDDVFAAYCDRGMTPELLERVRLPRQALHAAAIALPHPFEGRQVRAESPLPADMRAFLDRADAESMPALCARASGAELC
ncbi:RluA family pseudouridine synthase [Haliangium ochraceum]|uniref:Pseudouridine synthase n=1 Tax=Haliangium ochraceum (strain DSM 14365 / JCM 11303 / SMP-2) TaxID=502025 RepID=D0LU78_HALO1|nr:RluA family pseudouridine synthase [Haliangium ochraceum]ACY17442.1 pseudouridine synthase, RluA family [Haliangium ochraceum DSM 14365]